MQKFSVHEHSTLENICTFQELPPNQVKGEDLYTIIKDLSFTVSMGPVVPVGHFQV